MNDADFLGAFEAGAIPLDRWARSGADLEAVSAEFAVRLAACGAVDASIRSSCLLEKRAHPWSVHSQFELRRSELTRSEPRRSELG